MTILTKETGRRFCMDCGLIGYSIERKGEILWIQPRSELGKITEWTEGGFPPEYCPVCYKAELQNKALRRIFFVQKPDPRNRAQRRAGIHGQPVHERYTRKSGSRKGWR